MVIGWAVALCLYSAGISVVGHVICATTSVSIYRSKLSDPTTEKVPQTRLGAGTEGAQNCALEATGPIAQVSATLKLRLGLLAVRVDLSCPVSLY